MLEVHTRRHLKCKISTYSPQAVALSFVNLCHASLPRYVVNSLQYKTSEC